MEAERGLRDYRFTLSVDNLEDLMRVVQILGIIHYHLEALIDVVHGASEVGFPPGLVVGELVDFSTCYRPCLCATIEHLNAKKRYSPIKTRYSDLSIVLKLRVSFDPLPLWHLY